MTSHASGDADVRSRYRTHHEAGRRYGFSFGESSRAPLFLSWLSGRGRILDAGCRDGTLMRHYGAASGIVGCDIDDRALAICRARYGFPVVGANLNTGLPFRSGSFDAVVLGEVLEHLPAPAAVLREVHRVLAPGGLFVGSVPNAYRLKNRLRFLLGRAFDPDPTHLQFFSPDRLVGLLTSAGFDEVDLSFLESRFLRVHPRAFGNSMAWRARRP